MSTTTLHSIFTIFGIFAAFLTAISFLGTCWTGKIITKSNINTIKNLQLEISKIQTTIFSQSPLQINELKGDLYKHTFNVSVDAPKSNTVVITNLTSVANKIGNLEIQKTGSSGVRKRNGILIPFEDYLYIFTTDNKLNMETDSIKFSTKIDPKTDYIKSEDM